MTASICGWPSSIRPGCGFRRTVDESRYVEIEAHPAPGMALVSGSIRAADGAALEQRLEALAATVCDNDPRTNSQRRADACGPLAPPGSHPGMPMRARGLPGRRGTRRAARRPQSSMYWPNNAPSRARVMSRGICLGSGSCPPSRCGTWPRRPRLSSRCTCRPRRAPDPGYRPTAKTKEFLRWRDLTCCWPGCDKPVEKCDVDHTVP